MQMDESDEQSENAELSIAQSFERRHWQTRSAMAKTTFANQFQFSALLKARFIFLLHGTAISRTKKSIEQNHILLLRRTF
jgi:hypothetical protein